MKNKFMVNQKSAEGFRQNIIDSLDQYQTGFEIARDARVSGSFSEVVISGMGGSALPADILRMFCVESATKEGSTPVKVTINRSYQLPVGINNQECLHLVCSYSGNTEETLSCLQEALDNNIPCIGISAGGELQRVCEENNIPFVKLPLPTPTFQPRMGTGYFVGAFVQILVNHSLLSDIREEIIDSARTVKATMDDAEKKGKELATLLQGKTPVIYASSKFGAVAMIWKIKINENAKTPAFWNVISEMNHNEMVGYTNPQGKFHVILLKDPLDHPKNQKRYEVLLPLLEEKGVTGTVVDILGNTVYTGILNTLLLGDFMAYSLALAYDQDPEPVLMVEAFKKSLN